MSKNKHMTDIDRELMEREYLETIDNACLMQDTFFRKCIKDRPEVIRLMLRLILDDPDLEIESFKTQDDMQNLPYRSVEIDVFATNAKTGSRYNIEIQKGTSDNIRKRSRYHSSILDTHGGLMPQEPFDSLLDSIVIFICSDDILKQGKAIYRFIRQTDDGIPLEDGSTIIILNCSFRGEHPLRQLIEDLNESKTAKMNYKIISEAVRDAKEDQKEENHMKDMFEDAYERAEARGMEKGLEQSKIETAKKMLSSGKLSIDEISEFTSLPLETVKQLAG